MHDLQGEPNPTRTVVLYGNSLVISSFGASLQSCPGLFVLSMDAEMPDAVQRMLTLKPDIVMFDLATAHPDFAISLWKTQPKLLLIGVDIAKGEILVLSGSRQQVLSLTDLVGVIQAGEALAR
jgi:hypothetical protein